jgi:CheY-like chemotaxis protein
VPRVLIVEDHADTRLMYVEFLKMSFDVVEAADGRSALDAVRTHQPDAIVTDMSLPGMDGFEFVERVRRDPVAGGTPVVCLSGFGGDDYEERARRVGCDLLVQKPCLPDALVTAINEVLAQRRNRSRL